MCWIQLLYGWMNGFMCEKLTQLMDVLHGIVCVCAKTVGYNIIYAMDWNGMSNLAMAYK